MGEERVKEPNKGKLWHRLFGHAPLLLAAYSPTAIWFYCEDCRGHVKIETARNYVERLKVVPAGWDGGRPDNMLIETDDGCISEGERKRLLQRRHQEVGG